MLFKNGYKYYGKIDDFRLNIIITRVRTIVYEILLINTTSSSYTKYRHNIFKEKMWELTKIICDFTLDTILN